ncbi:hypothetical protein GGF46_000247 [Coemansia sp. RSA 552]|nr:hypothetical protein GGF46_000247 [Coemansia sp. RSA 552]
MLGISDSDSDSDGFFSDLRAFRQKLGLSDAAGASGAESDSSTTARATDKEASRKRPAPTPHRTAAAAATTPQLKRRGISDGAREKQRASLGGVSPGAIAALLSPHKSRAQDRRQRQRRASRAEGGGSSDTDIAYSPARSIPIRTPESRLAASNRTSPSSRRPTASPGHHAPMSPLVTPSRSGPLTMRSLWDGPSPLATPVRRRPPVQRPSTSAKRRLSAGLLGKVEEALVTEDDIDAAQRKIGEEKTLTQQQIIREVRERIVSFASDAQPSHDWQEAATLLCQFHTMGHGRLSYCQRGILWQGRLLGPIATVAQDMVADPASWRQQDTALVFPWSRVSAVRKKSIDDDDLLMATIDSDLGIAFQFDGDVGHMAELLGRQLQIAISDEHKQPGPAAVVAADGGAGGLARVLLQLAAGQGLLRSDDVTGALSLEAFSERAETLAHAWCQQLADEAQAALGKAASSGPGHGPPGTCTLCYAEEEAVGLQPCGHRVCTDCFEHLQRMFPSPSQAEEATADTSAICICPWDRCLISSWTSQLQ